MRARVRWLVLWIGYWVFLAVATHLPVLPRGAPRFPGSDKLLHFLVYGLLAWFGGRYLLARRGDGLATQRSTAAEPMRRVLTGPSSSEPARPRAAATSAIPPLRCGRLRYLGLWVGVYALYGALDEVTQSFVGRTPDVADWLANVLGSLAGTAWLCFQSRGGIAAGAGEGRARDM